MAVGPAYLLTFSYTTTTTIVNTCTFTAVLIYCEGASPLEEMLERGLIVNYEYDRSRSLYMVHNALCTLYSVYCTVYSVKCVLYSVQCTVCSVQYTVCSVQCVAHSAQYTVHSVEYTALSAQCTV